MFKLFTLFYVLLFILLYADVEKIAVSSHDLIFIDNNDFACHSRRSYVAVKKNGEIGLVYRLIKKDQSSKKRRKIVTLKYTSLMSKKTSIIFQKNLRTVRKMRYHLLYDSQDEPHVFTDERYDFCHYFQKKGHWEKEKLQVKFSRTWNGEYIRQIKLSHVVMSKKNIIYLVFEFYVGLKKILIFAHKTKKKWIFTKIPNVPEGYKKTFDIKIKNANNFSVLYNRKNHLCYATINNDVWHEEMIVRGGIYDEAGWEASLAIDNIGKIHVVSTFIRVVSTGSKVYSQLRWHNRSSFRKWKSEILAKKSRGYNGQDGTRYTGASPHIVFDKKNQAHIVFNDIASWHNSRSDNDFTEGNLRYMYQIKNSWQEKILYKQKGQAHKAQPLYEFLYPNLIIHGNKIHCFGVEKITKGKSTRYGRKNEAIFSLLHLSHRLRK